MENKIFEVVSRHLEEKRALFANNKLEREMLLQKLESEKLVFRGNRGILLVRQASEIMEFDAIHFDMWSRIKEDHRQELTHC